MLANPETFHDTKNTSNGLAVEGNSVSVSCSTIVASRRRESEKSLENESLGKEDESLSPTSKSPREEKLPLKVMPAPPPKENAWVKRSSNSHPALSQSSDSDQHSPTR